MRACFGCFLLLLLSVAGSAQSFTIAGKVVDARGGQPLPHTIVQLNPTTQRAASMSTVADDEGRFRFGHLAAGKYQLSASRRGYLTQSFQQHEEFSTAIAVGRDLPSDDLLFPLTPQSIVSGTITDEGGDPVRNAQVRVYRSSSPDGETGVRIGHSALTDDLGKYEFADLEPGDYYLGVSAQPWYAQRAILEFPGPADAENPPDPALQVAYPRTFYIDATDPDEATPIPLRGGEHVEINLSLSPQHAMQLRLPLVQSPGARYSANLSQSVFGVTEIAGAAMQRTENGDLIIDGVLPGHYEVTVNQYGDVPNKNGILPNKLSHFAADVIAGTTTLSPPELVSDVTVTGKVTGLEDKLSQAGIRLISSRPQRNYYAPIEAAGDFSMTVEPGSYQVIGNIPRMFLEQVTSTNATVHGRVVEVKSGASPHLEILAGRAFAQIDGFVTAGKLRPGGIMVLLEPEDAANNLILFRRDQSDSDGSFTLAGVIPGRYRLYAIEHGFDLQWMNPDVLRAFAKKSVAVEVHAGEKLQQSVEVETRQPE